MANEIESWQASGCQSGPDVLLFRAVPLFGVAFPLPCISKLDGMNMLLGL